MQTQTKGRTLTELAQALTLQKERSRDFTVPVSRLKMNDDATIGFTNGERHDFELNNWSGGQLASYTDIPKNYFDRIKEENTQLLANMVNHSLEREAQISANSGRPESRMLRTVDNKVRAIVSSKFRILDAYDLLNETLPILLENNFEPVSCELTEKRVYVKAVTKRVETEVKPGDPVQFGVMFSTSDVGAGSLSLEPFIYRLVCSNGLITESRIKQRHIGSNLGGDDIQELLSDKTKDMRDRAFFAQIRDVLLGSMRPEVFEREVNKMRMASEMPIKNFDLDGVVENTMRTLRVSGENTKKSILENLASGNQGAGLTMWGLANAFTATAKEDFLDYDQATELERVGGQIINMKPAQWKRIAELH